MRHLIYIAICVLFVSAAPKKKVFTKTTIKPKIFREWVGYSFDNGDISKMTGFFNFFGQIDPLNGGTSFPGGGIDTIYGFPRKQYDKYYKQGVVDGMYYAGDRGLNVVFDFAGLTDYNDTLHTWNITDLWGFNSLFDSGDTLYFYNLDVMFRRSFSTRSWCLARPDSLLTPFAKLVTTANAPTGAWVSTTCNINCRYMMIRATRRNRGAYFTIPDFSELSIYGTPNYDTTAVTPRAATYTGPVPSINTYGDFVGNNLGTGYDTLEMIYDGNVRVYGNMYYWDSARANTSTATATFVPDYFPDIGPTQYPFFKRTNRKFWWTIRGPSQYLNVTHPGAKANVDNWNGEPESFNYTRDAKIFGKYAQYWNGQIYYVENGNEDNYTLSVLCYFLRTSMDYDSIKTYSTMKLVMSGTTDNDPYWVDNFVWFSKIFRVDGIIPVDIINFHHYPRTVNILGYAPSLEQQVGAFGRSPEGDVGIGLAAYYTTYCRQVWNVLGGDTSKQIWNTEAGYGMYGTPAADPFQAAYPWDIGCTPSRGSWDSVHYRAIMMARMELCMTESPVTVYNEFFFHNSSFSTTIYPNLFESYGRVTGHNSSPPYNATTFYPWWYYRASIYNRLKWYRIVSTSGNTDTTGLHHQLWQKVDSATGRLTDSTCDIIWKNSQQGATASNQTVRIGYRKNSLVEKYVPSMTSVVGTSSTQAVLLNTLFLTSQDEQPTMFFGKSGASILVTQYGALKKVP